AGNGNKITESIIPGNIDTNNTWVVGALTNADIPQAMSNYGANVDCWAPGTDIKSTGLYGTLSKLTGTSFAAPHVAGILLLRENNTIAEDGSVTKVSFTAPIAVLDTTAAEYINGQWYTFNGMQLYRWNDQWWWLNANGEWAYWDGFDWVVA
ncbi:MAG: S8 family serine peptidase, partial [Bacteroidota bacterium]